LVRNSIYHITSAEEIYIEKARRPNRFVIYIKEELKMLGDIMGYMLGATVGVASNIKEGKEAIERFKTGKTPEQKKVIDFFTSGLSGCLNGGKIFSGMKMADYEQIISSRLNGLDLKGNAINKIGLDESEIEEIPPIVLSGYIWNDFDRNDRDDVVLVRAENAYAVSSRFSVSWIFFSQVQMYCYTYTFDTISDRIWERTMEFFYQDITCLIINKNLVQKIIDKGSMGCGCLSSGNKVNAESHSYYVDELEIVVPGRSYSFSMRSNEKLVESLHAAKVMVRERKYAH